MDFSVSNHLVESEEEWNCTGSSQDGVHRDDECFELAEAGPSWFLDTVIGHLPVHCGTEIEDFPLPDLQVPQQGLADSSLPFFLPGDEETTTIRPITNDSSAFENAWCEGAELCALREGQIFDQSTGIQGVDTCSSPSSSSQPQADCGKRPIKKRQGKKRAQNHSKKD
eukprot:3239833-Rhodomonas_salina.2